HLAQQFTDPGPAVHVCSPSASSKSFAGRFPPITVRCESARAKPDSGFSRPQRCPITKLQDLIDGVVIADGEPIAAYRSRLRPVVGPFPPWHGPLARVSVGNSRHGLATNGASSFSVPKTRLSVVVRWLHVRVAMHLSPKNAALPRTN